VTTPARPELPHGTNEPAAPTGDGGLVRVRLDLAYDGSGFAGWAAQPGHRTVQGVVEEALARILRTPVTLTVAGRTDAGVHATGQVAHADLPGPVWTGADRRRRPAGGVPRDGVEGGGPADVRPGEGLLRRLAGVLPPDVRVRSVEQAAAGFDARFSALWRRYAYRVTDDPAGANPLRRHDTLAWPRPLDLGALTAASTGLPGEHDFAAYCRRREGGTTIRKLQALAWQRGEDGVLTATVRADAFCHSMVRGLVGALLAVGDGRRPVDWPASLLDAAERSGAVTVAPAHGLTLVEVAYPPPGGLAARAETTRRRRGPAPG
jgi:tRNA pseudouridine38-40 synthase